MIKCIYSREPHPPLPAPNYPPRDPPPPKRHNPAFTLYCLRELGRCLPFYTYSLACACTRFSVCSSFSALYALTGPSVHNPPSRSVIWRPKGRPYVIALLSC